jgi:hypothetical protein
VGSFRESPFLNLSTNIWYHIASLDHAGTEDSVLSDSVVFLVCCGPQAVTRKPKLRKENNMIFNNFIP